MTKNSEKTYELDLKFDLVKSQELPTGYLKGIATTPKLDSYDDIIASGAFADSIKDRGVTGPRAIKMLAQHDSRHVIGNWKSLTYVGDALHVEGQIDLQTEKGAEYHHHVTSDQIGSMSVGFTTQIRQWDEDYEVRTIIKGDLREISLVTFPANEDAVILQIKSILGETASGGGVMKLSELEKQLARDFGLSRKQSCGVIRAIKSSKLFATTPPVPAAGGEQTEELHIQRANALNRTIAELKSYAALEEIRKLTEMLRS